jgi:hypothetical protein
MTVNGKTVTAPNLGETVTADNGDVVVYTIVNQASATPVPTPPTPPNFANIQLVKKAPGNTMIRPGDSVISYQCDYNQSDGGYVPSGPLHVLPGSGSNSVDLGHAQKIECVFSEDQSGFLSGLDTSYHIEMTVNGILQENPPKLGEKVTAQNGDHIVYTIVNQASDIPVPPVPPQAKTAQLRVVKLATDNTTIRPDAVQINYQCTFSGSDGSAPGGTGQLQLPSGTARMQHDFGHAQRITCVFTEPADGLASGLSNTTNVEWTVDGVTTHVQLGDPVTVENGQNGVYTITNVASVNPVPPPPPVATLSTIQLVKLGTDDQAIRPGAAVVDYQCSFIESDGSAPTPTGALTLDPGTLTNQLSIGHAKTITCTFTESATGLATGYSDAHHVTVTRNGVQDPGPWDLGMPITATGGETVVFTVFNDAAASPPPPVPVVSKLRVVKLATIDTNVRPNASIIDWRCTSTGADGSGFAPNGAGQLTLAAGAPQIDREFSHASSISCTFNEDEKNAGFAAGETRMLSFQMTVNGVPVPESQVPGLGQPVTVANGDSVVFTIINGVKPIVPPGPTPPAPEPDMPPTGAPGPNPTDGLLAGLLGLLVFASGSLLLFRRRRA